MARAEAIPPQIAARLHSRAPGLEAVVARKINEADRVLAAGASDRANVVARRARLVALLTNLRVGSAEPPAAPPAAPPATYAARRTAEPPAAE